MNLEYNLRGILHLFFRQKKKILLTFFIIFIPGFFMTMNLEPYYNVRSSILIKFGQNARLEVNLQNNGGYRGMSSDERSEILQSNVRILKSTDLIKKAIAGLEPEDIYPDMADSDLSPENKLQKTAQIISGNIEVFAGVDNYLIEVFVRHNDPETAVLINKRLINAFKKRHTEIYETPQINFLQDQAIKAQNQLDQSREEFKEFKKAMGVSEIDQEIAQLLKQKNDLSSIAYRSVTEAQENLASLEAQLAEMRATYRSDSPVMKSLRESIAVARSQLRARQKDMVPTEEVQEDGTLAAQTAAIDERIAWLEAQRGRYNELEQKIKLDEENIKYYRQRTEEARVSSMLNDQDISRITIIDEATIPLKPTGPRKKIILLALILLASTIAAAIAIVYELIDDRFSFPGQIRSRLGLPVLATFSKAEAM